LHPVVHDNIATKPVPFSSVKVTFGLERRLSLSPFIADGVTFLNAPSYCHALPLHPDRIMLTARRIASRIRDAEGAECCKMLLTLVR
jgi:hypothetical protein